jgi:(E)-4-hydroxy-3-methylbut-2-enyl-diphosphate synthase
MKRKKTRIVKIGQYKIGGDNPIRVQSMCNTDTRDIKSTLKQIKRLENAGCEFCRVAVLDSDAAKKIGILKRHTKMPIVADIHFDYKLALESIKSGADKIRINPGNIGSKNGVREIVKACKDRNVPIRVGSNAGSLKAIKSVGGKPKWTSEKWAKIMVREALEQVNMLRDMNFENIVVSLKADDIERTVKACRLFARKSDIPQHLGITEAGALLAGTVKSSIGLGLLLNERIGATIRVSFSEDPVLQVRCAYEILKALNLRKFGPDIISCPTCGRCMVDVHNTVKKLEEKIYSDKKLLKLSTGKKIAVMGCVVNGPGEARAADFGIAGGKGEGLFFEKGKVTEKIPQSKWIARIIAKILS